MRISLRIFGFPVFELAADESEWSGYGAGTSGSFELATEPSEGYYEDSAPGFGFGSPG